MKETLEKMVGLARLRLPKEEFEKFSKKAEHVVEYIEKLKELDTKNIEATSHATEVLCAFRDDVVKLFDGTQEILKIAPVTYQNLFEVPQVIEGEE